MFRFIFPLVFLFSIASQIAYCQKKDLSFEFETEVDYIFKDINQELYENMLKYSTWINSRPIKSMNNTTIGQDFLGYRNVRLIEQLGRPDFLSSEDLECAYDKDFKEKISPSEMRELLKGPRLEEVLLKRYPKNPLLVRYNLEGLAPFEGIRLKGKVVYHPSNNCLDFIPTAFAPLVQLAERDPEEPLSDRIYKKNTDTIYQLHPIFWCKPNYALTQKFSFEDPQITQIERTAKSVNLYPDQYPKIAKGLKLYIKQTREDYPKMEMYNRSDLAMSKEAKKDFLYKVQQDTLISFDPETFEEVLVRLESKFDSRHIYSFRFVHEWAWNEEEKRLYINTKGYFIELKRVDKKQQKAPSRQEAERWPDIFIKNSCD